MTINFTTSPGWSGVHYSIHIQECAKQAAYIDMPVAGAIGFVIGGMLAVTSGPLLSLAGVGAILGSAAVGGASAAFRSGIGFVVSCTLGRIADELTHDRDYLSNTLSVTVVRAFGGISKYSLTGPVTLVRLVAGAFNNGAYGFDSKTTNHWAAPIGIEIGEVALKCAWTWIKQDTVSAIAYLTRGGGFLSGIAAGLGVSFLGVNYTLADGAIALSLAIKEGHSHIDCEIAKGISYNEIEACHVINQSPLPPNIAGESSKEPTQEL